MPKATLNSRQTWAQTLVPPVLGVALLLHRHLCLTSDVWDGQVCCDAAPLPTIPRGGHLALLPPSFLILHAQPVLSS